ncbi:hypothetical protein MLD38_024338 [Melastoma candidum]|uniref:Uncharacterized protein n=1 Tax=Melastoma candidum TaxID=119954 RepID=A0ACB9NS30_9MYRT|nr:hypothetical protein MLD38_024338 [Melastoma candidum]
MKEVTEEPTPIRYPMHNHELAKFSVESWGKMILCKACDRKLSGEVYECRECLFFLHKECAEMPPEIDTIFILNTH